MKYGKHCAKSRTQIIVLSFFIVAQITTTIAPACYFAQHSGLGKFYDNSFLLPAWGFLRIELLRIYLPTF